MNWLFGNSIARRVQRAIEKRVKDAQKEHDEFCAKSDEVCRAEQLAAERKRDENKEKHAVEIVAKIIGK